ncbi:MAG: SH3 domain-containing protein [Chloroflexi bacterium]|nr:SH3 domain-containing protein [Chloroflexota bacterium]
MHIPRHRALVIPFAVASLVVAPVALQGWQASGGNLPASTLEPTESGQASQEANAALRVDAAFEALDLPQHETPVVEEGEADIGSVMATSANPSVRAGGNVDSGVSAVASARAQSEAMADSAAAAARPVVAGTSEASEAVDAEAVVGHMEDAEAETTDVEEASIEANDEAEVDEGEESETKADQSEDAEPPADPFFARVTDTGGRGLRVREGPGTNHRTLGAFLSESALEIVGGPSTDDQGRAWYQVAALGGSSLKGWSAGDYLSSLGPDEPAPTASRVAQPPAPRPTRTATPVPSKPAPSSPAPAPKQSSVAPAPQQGRSFTARLSAYTYQAPVGGAHGSITASGIPVRWGVVAVDRSVIPLGTRLLIEGFDTVFLAADTGGAVRGNYIDIFFESYAAAIQFGVQYRTVTVLSN